MMNFRTFFYTQAFFAIVFYFGICISHHACSVLYVKLCTPMSFYGLLSSPFMAMTPHCSALAWGAQTSRSHLLNMWVIAGNFGVSLFASFVLFATKKTSQMIFHDDNEKLSSKLPSRKVDQEDVVDLKYASIKE